MANEVIKALLVEIDGNMDKLRKELRAGERELGSFATKAKRTGAEAGAGADVFANKQANAARAVASATETIARQGKVGGEAVKQLIAQGANALLFFGPAGAYVGAFGIATLAVVGHFSRVKREAAEAAEAVQKSLADMVNAGDVDGLKTRARTLQFGTRGSGFTDGIKTRVDRLLALGVRGEDDEERAVSEADRQARVGIPGARERVAELRKLIAELKPLREEYKAVSDAILNISDEPWITQPLSAKVVTAGDPGATARAAAKQAAADARQAADELRREAAAFGERFNALVVNELGTAADNATQQIDAAIESAQRFIDAGTDVGENLERLGVLTQMRQEAMTATDALAGMSAALRGVDAATADGAKPTKDTFLELGAAIAAARAELATLTEDTARHARVTAELNKLLKAEADLTRSLGKKSAEAGTTGDKATTTLLGKLGTSDAARDMADYAREVQQAADGALQLAQNLGGASAETVGLLRGIGQIAGNVPALTQSLAKGSVGGVISSSLAIAGAISSILGDSPAEKQRQAELRSNTEAIRALTAKAGLLGVGVTGTAAQSATAGLRGFFQSGRAMTIGGARRNAQEAGLDLRELDRIASEYGITLNDNIESFRQLYRVLGDTIGKLGEFGTDVDSAKRQADVEIAMKGITDPLERFAIRQAATAGRSAALDRTTAGLDLSTAEGRTAARANALALLEVMKAGGARLGEGDLGGLTGDELVDALLELIETLNAAESQSAAAAGSTVGAVSGFRGLTEATGSRLEDHNRALVSYARDAQVTRGAMLAQLEHLVALSLRPLTVPALPAGFGSGAGAGAVVVNLQMATGAIQLVFPTSADPRDVAHAVQGGLIDTVQDALYLALRKGALVAGDLRVHRS